MIADWSRLTTLTTPAGNLALNAASGDRFLALNEKCAAGASLRFVPLNLSQASGQINPREYLTGYKMQLSFALWADDEPACGADAQRMLDTLGAHIGALMNPAGTTRIIWAPEGLANRMLNEIVLAAEPVVSTVPQGDDQAIVAVTFAVVSAFPHEMSEAEQTPASLVDGVAGTLTNDGTAAFKPVFKVYGYTSSFEITNADSLDDDGNPRRIVYDGTRPGGLLIGTSEYVEIDCFRGTAFLNGDDDDLAAGIDWTQTDFFGLEPGANHITIDGAHADVLWNDAWI